MSLSSNGKLVYPIGCYGLGRAPSSVKHRFNSFKGYTEKIYAVEYTVQGANLRRTWVILHGER